MKHHDRYFSSHGEQIVATVVAAVGVFLTVAGGLCGLYGVYRLARALMFGDPFPL